jgi:tRNA (guanine37-N1)-methyltransferase
MRFDIITIFPDLFTGFLEHGVVERARKSTNLDVRVVNLRDFAQDRHKSVDDRPYGGGEGMVFMPAPLFDAVEFCRRGEGPPGCQVVVLTPQGETWTQKMAVDFTAIPHVIAICGRYEGIDQRVIENVVDAEVSIGDFVLSGGEIPAMVILDSVVRLLPGVLGNRESAVNESFSTGLLDYPVYTRPADFRGLTVPAVLRSGNHAQIERWRRERALEKTWEKRPELVSSKDPPPIAVGKRKKIKN